MFVSSLWRWFGFESGLVRRIDLRQQIRPRLLRLEDRLAPSFGAIGPEFRVNSYTTYGQTDVQVAADADGDFVVVWTSYRPDGSGIGVYAQRYSSAGATQGAEFRVNTNTIGHKYRPTVAANAGGDFVVAWQSVGQDGTHYDIYARRYNSAGAPQDGEFRVNEHTTDTQEFATVAIEADGDFVVVWNSYNQDGSGDDIFGRRYSAAGTPRGGDFRINSHTTGGQGIAAVAGDGDGNFIATWHSVEQDGAGFGIYAQRYSSVGARLGAEFRVNTFTTSDQVLPTVATNAAGDFVVAWNSYEQDGSHFGIFAQRFSAAGVPLGVEFPVNTFTTGRQQKAAVSADAAGDFVVSWESDGQDGSGYGIIARRFNAAGFARGDDFQVNTRTTDRQEISFVAADADGDIVVVWQSDLQDGDGAGIYGQRYHANRPPTASGLPNTSIPLAPPTNINLSPGFADADDGVAGLTFSVTGNTNSALFTSTTINGSTLTLTPAGANGSATLTLRATDPDGDFVETSFAVTVGAVPPQVSGTQVNGGSQQRSRVTTLSVTFSAQVTFAGTIANAFTLTRTGGAPVAFIASATVTNGVTVVTLNNFTGAESQFGSLRDGRYTLTALASQIREGSVNMASNYTFGDTQGLFRYYGDMTGDRRVDIADFGFFSLAYLTPANYNAALDFNNDGRIDIADFGQFSVRFFTTLP